MLGPDATGSNDAATQLEIARITAARDVEIEHARERGRTTRTGLREAGKTARSRLRNWGTAIIAASIGLTTFCTTTTSGATALRLIERWLT